MITRHLLACTVVTLCITLSSLVSAQEVSFAGGAVRLSGTPGDYVSLIFELQGQGDFTYQVETPSGWSALTPSGVLRLEGEGFVAVTVRVPRQAPVGEVPIVVRLLADDRVVATREGVVVIGAQARVEIQAPRELEGSQGRPLDYAITVVNLGNRLDTFSLSAEHANWEVGLSERQLTLGPGDSTTVTVTLVPTSRTSAIYRHVLQLVAVSANDPDVSDRVLVESIFRADDVFEQVEAQNPQLLLTVETEVEIGLEADENGVTPVLSYGVAPSLDGQLSDYIDARANVDSAAGSLETFFDDVPSRLSLGFDADRWDASATLSRRNYQAQGGFDVDDWRFDVRGSYTPGEAIGLNLSALAISRDPALDLQLLGQTVTQGRSRTETVAATYRVSLGDGFILGTGLNLSGSGDEERPYGLQLGVQQSLSWQDQDLDVTQSYTGVPLEGLHTLGVSGGMRSIYPFGVRGATFAQLSSAEQLWRNTVTFYGQPLDNVTASLRGSYAIGSSGSSWSVAPTAGARFDITDSVPLQVSAGYAYSNDTRPNTAASNLFRVGLSTGYEAFRLSVAGLYETTGATPENPAEWDIEIDASARYALNLRSNLLADYGYTYNLGEDNGRAHVVGLSWLQTWNADLSSRVGYVRQFGFGSEASSETLLLTLVQRDFLQDGLTLSAGYALSSEASFFDPAAPLEHDLRFSLGYTVVVPFDTPEPIVSTFGGRRGGAIEGVAYVDRNLNGLRDDNERPVRGLRIQLGSDSAVTDADGFYSLRLSEGRYPLEFTEGFSANLSLSGESAVTIELNQTQERDLAFVPVVPLEVTLFNDTNQNGVLDDGELGIPYGGLRIVGPTERQVRTGAAGRVTINNLVPGSYQIVQNEAFLPARYRPTTPAATVVLREGVRPAPVTLGAAEPPRQVVTTFSGNRLAVIVRANRNRLPAGADVEVQALVSGTPERVSVFVAGREVGLEPQDNRWTATVRIPVGTPPGSLTLRVVAEAADQRVEQTQSLTITDEPRYTADDIDVTAGEETTVRVTTLFRAETGALLLATGEAIPLQSEDGYRWTATWQAPDAAFETTASLVFDDAVIGEITVVVEPSSTSEEGAQEGGGD